MRIVFFILTFLLFSKAVYSQSRIGSYEKDIRSEFIKQKMETGFDDNKNRYLSVEFTSITAIYYFASNGKCIITFIIPDNQGSLNSMVENYNGKYVIVSDKKWKMYSDNGILDIELIFPNEGKAFFVIKSN